MTHTVIWLPEAMTAYRRLRARDQAGAQHLAAVLRSLASDSHPAGSSALGDSTFRRLRFRQYRVLYEVDDEASTVYIVAVGVTPS